MDKAVILARGLGKRMRQSQTSASDLSNDQSAAADTGTKAMIPIDKPFLDYVLHNLAEAGYRRICLVIGPEHNTIKTYYTQTVQPKRLTIDFAIQPEPLGTADAVFAARSFAGDDHFLVINSDNYYPLDALQKLQQLNAPGLAAFDRDSMIADSNISADKLIHFAVIQSDAKGNLIRVIEKPNEQTLKTLPAPICLSMNCWSFAPQIFEGCQKIKPSPRGELELPDAVQFTIDALSQSYKAITIKAPVLDLSRREDIAAVTKILKGTQVNL